MHTVLLETDSSTAVNLSVYGKFLPGNGRQLVTVGAKHLRVFRANPYAIVLNDAGQEFTQTTQLECLLSVNFMSPPRSMVAARVPLYPECDCLLMTFDDAKLAFVSIDPATMRLNTLSLHSIEDEFLRDGYTKDIFEPKLVADPGNRCAAFLVYGRHLGVVPFPENSRDLLHSYTVSLRSIDERLDSIIDMTFLHGYYEPTLLLLYEPIQTTAGRAAIRYDTVSILGVSLNVKDKVTATVWRSSGLPMTIHSCLSLPPPVAGVCLFGDNEIVYLNQSVPPCGISLNSCAEGFTRFPLNNERHWQMTLDGCAHEVLSPNEIFVCSRNGDLYVLSLTVDLSNAVKSMKLNKVAETSIPCTITACSAGYMFLGSRLGDSKFLQYTREAIEGDVEETPSEEPQAKKARVEEASPADSNGIDEEDEFLYGGGDNDAEHVEEKTVKRILVEHEYKFRELDSLVNVGPCKAFKCCAASDVSTYFRKEPRDLLFDMVSASGHGKDASLCFFQRTVRPSVVTTSVLEEALEFWTVGRREDDSHKYLVVAREVTTLVLELGSDMVELETPLFVTSETTVAAGELATGSLAVQVTAMNIVLVAEDRQLEVLNVNSNFPVASASIVDPFIVLLTQNGRIILYRLMTSPDVHLREISLAGRLKHDKSPVTAVSIYKDISGIVQLCSGSHVAREEVQPHGPLKNIQKEHLEASKEDDIDLLLYGGDDAREKQPAPSSQATRRPIVVDQTSDDAWAPTLDTDVQNPNHVMPTYWMLLTRENGNMYIYGIPEVQLVYVVKKFTQLTSLLVDASGYAHEDETGTHNVSVVPSSSHTGVGATASASGSNAGNEAVSVKAEEVVMELQLYGMGMNQSRPVLAALVDDTVVLYEMFAYDNGIDGHLAIRFRRLPDCAVITRAHRFLGPNGRAPVEAARDVDRHRPLIHTFERIGRLTNGVFVCGNYPTLLVMERGEAQLHPLIIDGPIVSFTPFNNVNCPNGYLYLTGADRMMRISQLPSGVLYDSPYPVRKVPIGETVHFVDFLLQSSLLAVATSMKETTKKQCVVLNEDKTMETHERDEHFVYPTFERYTIRLFSTEDWKFVPNTEIQMEEFEVVTCCQEVLLHSESTVAGVQGYLAIGTSLNYGEEVFVRGRIIICEIIDVVPEEGLPTSRHKIKTVYDKEQKGPVTSMCACNGFLLTGMGQKIFIWQFRDNNLHGISFLDMHFYIHHLTGFRSMALACDLYRSVSLIRYQEKFKALSLVSRDFRPTAPSPMVSEFLLDRDQLAFVLSDEAANISVFSYLPETKEAVGGERLILRSVLNIGSLVNAFVRIKGHASESLVDKPEEVRQTQTCYFATLDGSFGVLRPISEKVFRRLHMLQQLMTSNVPQPAGLNPRGSRAARPQRTHTNQQIAAARAAIDGNFVYQYLDLSVQEKNELAKRLGSSRYQIIDDLVEFRRVITHY